MARLPAGDHVVGLSPTDDDPRELGTRRWTAGSSTTVTATYRSRRGWRAAGFVLALTGAIVGPYLMATSFGKPASCAPDTKCADTTVDEPRFVAGFALIGAGVPTGIILLFQRDEAALTVGPGVATGTRPAWEGLTLRGRF